MSDNIARLLALTAIGASGGGGGGALTPVVVNELPSVGEEGVLYLVSRQVTQTKNVFDEYIYVNGDWEKIGTTDIDFTNYYTKTETDTNFLSKNNTNSYTPVGNYNPATKKYVDDMLNIPTIAVTSSQIVSVAPLKILLTGEQVNILNDKNNIGVFLDGSAIDSLLVGHAYRNGDVTHNGKSFVSYTLDYPHWNNDSEFIDYNIGLLILDKATNILTVSIEPVMTETSFRAAFFDGTEEEWDALTQSQKESILFAAVSQEFELTQEEEETLLSVLGDDKAGIDVDTTLEETLDAFLNIAGENE